MDIRNLKFVNVINHIFYLTKDWDQKKEGWSKILILLFEKIRNLFLTFEDVHDSWDGYQEPKMVPMISQRPYLSFAKKLEIPHVDSLKRAES